MATINADTSPTRHFYSNISASQGTRYYHFTRKYSYFVILHYRLGSQAVCTNKSISIIPEIKQSAIYLKLEDTTHQIAYFDVKEFTQNGKTLTFTSTTMRGLFAISITSAPQTNGMIITSFFLLSLSYFKLRPLSQLLHRLYQESHQQTLHLNLQSMLSPK